MKKAFAVMFVFPIMLLLCAVVFAQNNNRTDQPVHWITGGEQLVLTQGQTYEWVGRFYSDELLPSTFWMWSGALGPTDRQPALYPWWGSVGLVEESRIYTVHVTLVIAPDQRPGLYRHTVVVRGPRSTHPTGANDPWGVIPEHLVVEIQVVPSR